MNILFEEGQVVGPGILATMEKAAEKAVELEIADGYTALEPDRIEVSVTFVSMEEIHELNLQYREVDSPTDVLSFPQFWDLEDDIPEVGPIELGDVIICKDKAEEQAKEFGHSFEREIIYLFTHSILHLLGYDHMEEDEKAVMRAREEEIMDYLGIPRR